MKRLRALAVSFSLLFIVSCGWHLRNINLLPKQMEKLIFNCSDSNGPLSKAIRRQLRLNNVELVEEDALYQSTPSFRLLNSSLSRDPVSIFQNGHTAEYQMVLSVNAEILMPNKEIYSISTKVRRSFVDNPKSALSKDDEQEILINEMYDRAAEQLIFELSSMQLKSKTITGASSFY